MGLFKKGHQTATDAVGAFTIIKRVVPTAGGFYCGICRALHPTWSAASICVEGCWETQLHAQPTVAIRKGMFVLHRCRFCKREYADPADATACAQQCSETMVADANQEASQATVKTLSTAVKKMELPFTISARTVSPVVLHEMSRTALMPFQIHNRLLDQKIIKPLFKAVLKHAAAIATGYKPLTKSNQTHGGNGMTDARTKDANNGNQAAKGKDPNKKFFRDGAKYVCAVCRAKFFTKIEVESCWDKH
ncbi:MAG: hypothetical protein RIQ81_523 [Pseudomonadota bacterium]